MTPHETECASKGRNKTEATSKRFREKEKTYQSGFVAYVNTTSVAVTSSGTFLPVFWYSPSALSALLYSGAAVTSDRYEDSAEAAVEAAAPDWCGFVSAVA
jgi:hypothetical protein